MKDYGLLQIYYKSLAQNSGIKSNSFTITVKVKVLILRHNLYDTILGHIVRKVKSYPFIIKATLGLV